MTSESESCSATAATTTSESTPKSVTAAKNADESLKQTGYILHCFNCMHRETANKIFGKSDQCPECGAKMDYAGPLWIGNISDPTFIEQIIKENQNTAFKNSAKITKLLT